MTSTLARLSCVSLAVALGGCKLLATSDGESARGSGPASFNPYQSSASGAIRLSLQQFNGCSVLATGAAVSRGSARIPYPDQCPNLLTIDPNGSPVVPTARMKLVADTDYFLNQLTLVDSVINLHVNPANPSDASRWISTQSRFKALDWTNFGKMFEQYVAGPQGSFIREVFFGNATWQTARDDSVLVEILDVDGLPRERVVYSRREFLAESPVAGHTRLSWQLTGVGKPAFPGDTALNVPLGAPPVVFRTMARIDWVGSTNPFKTIKFSGLTGDGAVRVTWSQLPNAPFYFPVQFIPRDDPSLRTCFKDGQAGVACDFGIVPEVTLSPPRNGKTFYEPGEQFNMYLAFKDGAGNLLHDARAFPSYRDLLAGNTNGLLYFNPQYTNNFQEQDVESAYKVAGPIDLFRPWNNEASLPAPYFQYPIEFEGSVIDFLAVQNVPALDTTTWPTRIPVQLPADAKPGTYVALLKGNRQFLGERLTRTGAFFFEVGQETPTKYPGRVGNCQICHRGVLSLDNVRHGLKVDHVESCKTCHGNILNADIHQLHNLSLKFPQNRKNECTLCHLTRESATRPSLDTCSGCHADVHGTQYFNVQFNLTTEPTRYGNCAQSCHVNNLPKNHILPAE